MMRKEKRKQEKELEKLAADLEVVLAHMSQHKLMLEKALKEASELQRRDSNCVQPSSNGHIPKRRKKVVP